jgi:HNH endonuclease
MLRPGDVISYLTMCAQEGVNLQRGMNFRLRGGRSVILMSLRPGAPYADRVEDDGRVLIYEGHDVPRRRGGPEPKGVDQPRSNPGGSLTDNGLFEDVALRCKEGKQPAERVIVYEKIRSGLWVYNGVFQLVDAWEERSGSRSVFKFKLELLDDPVYEVTARAPELEHNRLIPSDVKRAVWKRDKGHCVQCGASDNLHFDHVIPYSKGGSSLVAENVQLLCARHNLAKHDRIE